MRYHPDSPQFPPQITEKPTMDKALEGAQAILNNIRKVIVGKDEKIQWILTSWISGGHLLLEDNPGTGKTMLARALAASCDVPFRRIQFTPDLLPADVVGTTIYNQKNGEFSFMKGPVFTTILLADEINRATPRTQSALLEAMGERQVSVDGTTSALDPLFFVIATQNPIEQHGTFPLPEAQLDRFMFKISMGYPEFKEEIKILKAQNSGHPIEKLGAVATQEAIQRLRSLVPRVKVDDRVYQYAMNIVTQTRISPEIKIGASPRASFYLIRAAQSLALLQGQTFVRPDHIRLVATPVLAHRIIPSGQAQLSGKTNESILDGLLGQSNVQVA